MITLVGNDLIDLRAAHNRGRARQPRIVGRTLTAAERDLLQLDGGGDFRFALLWSAKEAAYKAARKRDPALVFAPRRWNVEVGPPMPSSGDRAGSVSMPCGTRVEVRWEQGPGWVHCLALLGDRPEHLERAVAASIDVNAGGSFSEREREGFTCAESAAARNLAKRLLRHQAAGEIEILRARRGAALLPPKAYAGAAPLAGVDLSLSHDGCFVAAVICVAGKSAWRASSASRARHGSDIQCPDRSRVTYDRR